MSHSIHLAAINYAVSPLSNLLNSGCVNCIERSIDRPNKSTETNEKCADVECGLAVEAWLQLIYNINTQVYDMAIPILMVVNHECTMHVSLRKTEVMIQAWG